MKKINLYKIFAILFIAISASCVDNNDFELPTIGPDKQYENLKSLDEIIAQYNGNPVEFVEDVTVYGYVVSDDREGNFFKSIIIQDKPENPTVGLEVRIDDTNLGARYNVGRKIYIKLKGLALSKYFASFQIGVLNGNSTDRIDANDYIDFIDRSSEIAEIVPTNLTIGELTDNHINTLVKIEGLQSEEKGLTYADPDPDNTFSVNRYFTSCETFESIIMRTSGFATFKSYPIPDKKGSVTAILNKFRSDYQLFIRDTNDVNFTEEYGCNNNPTEASLAEVKALYTGSETTVTQNLKLKLVITSDLSTDNISNQNAFAQDATAGIALRFSDAYDLKLGDEIEIAVGGAKLSEYNGLLQLNVSPSNILSTTAGTLPTPEIITIAQALTGDYQGKLVQIEGVQFKDNTKNYDGSNQIISECDGDELTTYVRPQATFANNPVSNKRGTITGVMSDFNGVQIYLRNESDVNFTEDYTTCGGGGSGTTNTIFFSELADPNNNANARFIELYNSGTDAIDLTGWIIRRYTNDATSSTSSIDLSGQTIAAGSTFVIAKNATEFSSVYGVTADMESTSAAADSNGDDQLELVDPSGTVIDIFGIIGEDGSGTNHEFEDGRANRKASVTQGNPTYTFSEWDIWNDTGAAGTTNAPQDAPGAFTPKVR
ncbi:DUF5689 domain-containing protein [Tenacibaculum singaporense]|uniref:DUF5689 domain-containing protein n=1 Tax=Tenacibaculum singaporense TaxID=2358479 RepID=UPI000F68FAB1|nr:DUF5689 domain-containing protein [Tenacibaculum singaporense]RSC94783.1 lamin tail domain-containing protein [Tenacibaculum singaporense]